MSVLFLQRARVAAALLAGAFSLGGCASSGTTAASPGADAGFHTLVWHDEFDGPAGAPVDSTKWVHDVGGQGGGNQELEYYTPGTQNAALDGDGHLVITAQVVPPGSTLACWYGPCRYTSARLKTQGLFTQAYGRFEARIRIPRGQGMWPAFWLLGDDIDRVGWPKSGEIDVMENIGREPAIVHGTIHGPGYSGAGGPSRADTLARGAFADDFHVYAITWQPDTIRWLVDGHVYHTETPAMLPAGTRWVYDHPFFMLLNLAVGGGWPGNPDSTTTFPQRMIVDYVRVYGR